MSKYIPIQIDTDSMTSPVELLNVCLVPYVGLGTAAAKPNQILALRSSHTFGEKKECQVCD